jgi:drug/metabolite transporter (DMT)-like permease
MQPATKNDEKLAWGLLVLLALIWGTSFILMKKGLTVFTPGQVAAYRIVVAFLIFLPWAIGGWRQVPPAKWKYIIVAGILGNLIPAFLFTNAQMQMESSVAGILNTLTPIFTFLVSVLFFGQPAKKWQMVGLALGFAGAVGLSFVAAGGQVGTFNAHALLILVATICYGISVNTISKYLAGVKSLIISASAMLVVGPLALAHLLSGDFVDRVPVSPQSWAAFGYITVLGVLSTALGLLLFNKLVKITSPVFASAVTYIIPIFALGWGLLDGEHLTYLHLLGMTLIVAGVYAVNKGKA